MEALEFIRERNRMCKHFRLCAECPANGVICGTIGEGNDAERLVQIVEAWAKEHPHKTRQREFLEQWPEARVEDDGVLSICTAKGKRGLTMLLLAITVSAGAAWLLLKWLEAIEYDEE